MEIAILFALILLNGVFAMSEIALVTARKARLQKLIDEGDAGAAAAAQLGADPTRFLSTIQIGITSIGVLNGIVGEAALAAPLAEWLGGAGGPPGPTVNCAACSTWRGWTSGRPNWCPARPSRSVRRSRPCGKLFSREPLWCEGAGREGGRPWPTPSRQHPSNTAYSRMTLLVKMLHFSRPRPLELLQK